ncbi:MAG TPA: TauD/TfdA family dioxygenase [Burkholderiaceae bacterium]|nr:TauD/TfdA family dioxygenase [Burkholderiaceae bacterium]
MSLQIEPSGAACGATVRGADLSSPLSDATVAEIRAAWLEHGVVAFPDQRMSIEDLERFTLALGPRGDDPYIAPIPGHRHVVEIRREPDEQAPIFAETWHSDWSFLPIPPAATALYGTIIPPVGGDTLFACQAAAWDALPDRTKARLRGRLAVHSARRGYARDGMYGERDRAKGRSMAIRFGDDALATRSHPIARVHPETGRTVLFVSPGYTIGIEGMDEAESTPLLMELFEHQKRPEFVYRHRWSAGMLLLWDNRRLVHAATGGYEGHRRLLHRITIAERAPLAREAA